jgi:hypothetical protein
MESMPFLHAERVFNIIFAEDLTFVAVHEILDQLFEMNAFEPEVQEERAHYTIHLDQWSFSVWVSEMDVLIEVG